MGREAGTLASPARKQQESTKSKEQTEGQLQIAAESADRGPDAGPSKVLKKTLEMVPLVSLSLVALSLDHLRLGDVFRCNGEAQIVGVISSEPPGFHKNRVNEALAYLREACWSIRAEMGLNVRRDGDRDLEPSILLCGGYRFRQISYIQRISVHSYALAPG